MSGKKSEWSVCQAMVPGEDFSIAAEDHRRDNPDLQKLSKITKYIMWNLPHNLI